MPLPGGIWAPRKTAKSQHELQQDRLLEESLKLDLTDAMAWCLWALRVAAVLVRGFRVATRKGLAQQYGTGQMHDNNLERSRH